MKRLIYLTVAFIAGCMAATTFLSRRDVATVEQGRRETVYDTLPYPMPVARDSVVVRYEISRLPLLSDTTADKASISDTTDKSDSVAVAVPITQKEYADSTYHAWVSGYAVNLDSIHTYTHHDYTTVILPQTKVKRWHIGPTVGYGCTPHGIEPFIGISLTYSIIDL